MNFKYELIAIRNITTRLKYESDKAIIRKRIQSDAEFGWPCCMSYEWIHSALEVATINGVINYIINDLGLEAKESESGSVKYIDIRWSE